MLKIEDNIPAIESIFDQWKGLLGSDYHAYKNHVYRMFHFCMALLHGNTEDKEKIVIAACFHDIAIWDKKTLDYLEPSAELAKIYLNNNGKAAWSDEIELMIRYHHKLTRYRDSKYPLVETFRQADLIDVSKGLKSFGLPKKDVKAILNKFPNSGFHRKLVSLTVAEFKKSPFRPLPMMKW